MNGSIPNLCPQWELHRILYHHILVITTIAVFSRNTVRDFFSKDCNTDKLRLMKGGHDSQIQNRIKIIMGTNLITNKVIASYKINQRYWYLVREKTILNK